MRAQHQRSQLQLALDDHPGLFLLLVISGVVTGMTWFVWWGVHFPTSLIASALALALFRYWRKHTKMPRWQLLWMYALCVFAAPAALALYALTKVEKWGEWLHTEA